MNCEQIDELLAALCVDALAREEDAAVRAHLVTCRRHDEALAELWSVAERLPLTAEEREPSAGLRSRLLDAFDAELAAARVTAISSARRPSFAARPRFAYLAAAAVLVLAMAGLVAWNVVLQTGGGHEATMVVHLVGDGSGELVYVPDQQVAVMKLDLPELPSGRSYQAWRIDNGEPASLGLVPNAGMIAMDVDLNGAGAVAISEEPAGGSDKPTTRPLVAGELPNLRGSAGFLAASLPSPRRTVQHHPREEAAIRPDISTVPLSR
jgi:anti-sigma-K factor RskA